MNLRHKFLRNTHDNGEFRKTMDEFWDEAKRKDPKAFDCIHFLDSKKPLTFSELVAEIHRYNAQENEPLESAADIAYSLVRLLELDAARMIVTVEEKANGQEADSKE